MYYKSPTVEIEELEDYSEREQDHKVKNMKYDVHSETNQDEFRADEKLQMITEYLRSQYFYCLWCGISFADADDMRSNCPGSSREDHDD